MIVFADISEFQQSFDAPAYLAGGHDAIIVRTHNGYRADNLMPGRRDYVRGQPFAAVGYYQYLVADRDPAQQAQQFIDTTGQLRANEYPILDLEEGSGNQVARAEAWFDVIDPWCGFAATLYSGEYFLRDQLGGTARWGDRPLWIANYSDEPAGHDFWQYSSTEHLPGLSGGVDANRYSGTSQQLLSLVRKGASIPPETEDDIVAIAAAVASNGSFHVFVEAQDGSVWYTYQSKGKTAWNGGQPGKSVAALSFFAPAPKK